MTPENPLMNVTTNSGYQFKDVAPRFPAELKQLSRWIVRTADKRPFSAFPEDDNLGPIDPHDEKYQAEYDTALGALEETTRYSGVGFVFNRQDGLNGTDIDNCVNPETLEIRPDVLAIIAKADSYSEFSPSMTGVHIFTSGWQFPIGPAGEQGGKVGKAEMYSGKRYFTVTGNHIPGTPLTVNNRNLDWLYERIIRNREFVVTKPASNSAVSAAESSCVVTRKTTIIASKYETLMKGAITRSKDTGSADFAIEDENQILVYPSQSEADLALLRLLTDKIQDVEAVKAAFLESPLGERDKAKRKGYLDGAIAKLQASPRLPHVNTTDTGEENDGISIDRPKLLTEVGNARRLIEAHGKNIRYCHDLDSWYFFNGKVWVADRKAVHIQDLMKRMLMRIQNEASQQINGIEGISELLGKLTKSGTPKRGVVLTDEDNVTLQNYTISRPLLDWAKASESNQKIRGAVEQARSEPGISINKSQFDVNPLLCNLENGTLVFDYKKAAVEFRKHLREDLCTRRMPVVYDPDADCPQFKRFLEWMFPDKDVRNYVLTYLSLCLTGRIVRAILILFGEGANGKSTLIKTMYQIFGRDQHQYGASVAFSTFSVGREESAGGCRADLVPLDGPRMITASESNKSHTKLDMARLKELTGGDQTVARGLYSPEPKSFYNQGKIVLLTNNLPTVSDDSDAAWERLKLVECRAHVANEDQDRNLPDKLANEASGILNLLISHILMFFREGFKEPESIKAATDAYRGSESHINRFVQEQTEIGKETFSAPSSEFYARYRNWCMQGGEEPETNKAVTQYLERRLKIKIKHTKEGSLLRGIRLKHVNNVEHEGNITFG